MWESQKQEVLETAQQMSQKGFVVGTSGNVSLRFRDSAGTDLVAITPSGRPYDTMKLNDIVVVDLEGVRTEGELTPSIETMMHTGIYKARRKVNAIMHTHPVYGSIVAVAGLEIPAILDDQVTQLGGEIRVARYALSGSPEMTTNVLAALGPRNAALMANHGALAMGRNLREAFSHCQLLEKTAQVFVFALALRGVTPVPIDAAEVERAFFNAVYGEG